MGHKASLVLLVRFLLELLPRLFERSAGCGGGLPEILFRRIAGLFQVFFGVLGLRRVDRDLRDVDGVGGRACFYRARAADRRIRLRRLLAGDERQREKNGKGKRFHGLHLTSRHSTKRAYPCSSYPAFSSWAATRS